MIYMYRLTIISLNYHVYTGIYDKGARIDERSGYPNAKISTFAVASSYPHPMTLTLNTCVYFRQMFPANSMAVQGSIYSVNMT